jgi:hypothetical protein
VIWLAVITVCIDAIIAYVVMVGVFWGRHGDCVGWVLGMV